MEIIPESPIGRTLGAMAGANPPADFRTIKASNSQVRIDPRATVLQQPVVRPPGPPSQTGPGPAVTRRTSAGVTRLPRRENLTAANVASAMRAIATSVEDHRGPAHPAVTAADMHVRFQDFLIPALMPGPR